MLVGVVETTWIVVAMLEKVELLYVTFDVINWRDTKIEGRHATYFDKPIVQYSNYYASRRCWYKIFERCLDKIFERNRVLYS